MILLKPLTATFSAHSARMMSVGSLISRNISEVIERITKAVAARSSEAASSGDVRLVCVTKTKPNAAVLEAYNCGNRHFGENYINELEEKSLSLLALCPEIKWHFIGHLQKNKIKKVLRLPNLYMIETIHSKTLADNIEKHLTALDFATPLKVMVQVNTSGETQKSGISPAEVCDLVNHIKQNCPHLDFVGLMTIGSFNHDYSTGPNPDFMRLLQCRQDVCDNLKMRIEDVEVSMGMSNDFEQAIAMGSTNVRVGSTIFGAREYPVK